jgi:hypothetical protein
MQFKRERAVQETFSRRLIESQENERKRIALELHDDIGQRLSLLSVALDEWEVELPSRLSFEHVQLSGLRRSAKELVAAVHDLSHQLHSSTFQHLGLVGGLRGICRSISHVSSMMARYWGSRCPSVGAPRASLAVIFQRRDSVASGRKRYQVSWGLTLRTEGRMGRCGARHPASSCDRCQHRAEPGTGDRRVWTPGRNTSFAKLTLVV